MDDRLLNKVISSSVPSRAALAGNPSDLAMGQGIGAVFSMPLRNYVATVSLHPSEYYHIKGPETATSDFSAAISQSLHQGIGNGENLFLAANMIFKEMLKEAGIDPIAIPFSVYWSTTIPRQRGLSGSSAMIIAYLKALIELHRLADHELFCPARLANWALRVETEHMGIAAGLQDRVVQSFADSADAVLMDFSARAFSEHNGLFGEYRCIKIKNKPPLILMVADEPSHSGQAHQNVKTLVNQGNEMVLRHMRQLATLAFKAAGAFEAEDWDTLGKVMLQNAELRVEIYGEKTLGEVNIAILDICRQANCFPNFTGSGGAAIVLLSDNYESAILNLKENIKKSGHNFALVKLA